MKNIFFIVAIIFSSTAANAQLLGDPNMNNYTRMCRTVPLTGMYGDSFYNPYSQERISTSFSTHFWMSAKDQDEELRLAAGAYLTANQNDFVVGPLNAAGENFSNAEEKFNRVWKIYGHEVQALKEAYDSGNIDDYYIPKDIIEWPAYGNPHFPIENGEFLDQGLAPFWDENGDGVYDPKKGDLPMHNDDLLFLTRNSFWSPFMMTFVVYNDVTEHRYSKGEILGVEIQQITYMFRCPSIEEMDMAIFTRHKITNKSMGALSQFKLGYFDDPQLEFSTYSGCSQNLNTIYNYKYNIDDPNINGGSIAEGFTRNLIFLDKKLEGYLAFGNSSIGVPNVNTVDPASAFQFDNYLNLKWLDGSPISPGGDGYNTSNTDETKFMYPDLPNDENGWSMFNDQTLGDIRNLAVLEIEEELKTLQPGQSIKFEVANHVILEPDYPGVQVFDVFEDRIETLLENYQEINNNPSVFVQCFQELTSTDNIEALDLIFYPNPTSDILQIQLANELKVNTELYNAQGKLIGIYELEAFQNTIDISSNPNGIYYLVLKDKLGQQISKGSFVIAK